ncbi:hypothetical protein BGC07_16785 [Piscirickettsia litoralis]|uniref:Uncharacterized protein n=2 Tax=Piscirickettsia litoralis TaxID=1891921 RepID=A0ABX2ZXS9_9GAMM|nr:hypothetical protein BGC07_16785 [Piscirickettsia litoralis]
MNKVISKLKELSVLGVIFSTAALSACSSLTPTQTTKASYVIYDVKASEAELDPMMQGIKEALQKNTSKVVINENPPPYPLPKKPGHFVKKSLNDSGLGAFAALSGTSLPTLVSCPDAVLSATATESRFMQYGQHTTMWVCLYAYDKGYALDINASYSEKEGAWDVNTLSEMMVKPALGSSEQFIPRTFNDIIAAVKKAGGKLTYVAGYPAATKPKKQA